MANTQNLMRDIQTRTKGEIHIGVVGPVRCGKSTFIRNFMQKVVLPRIDDAELVSRLTLELPPSADGTDIMTTGPKFVPEKAVAIKVAGQSHLKLRMIDCVGYLIDGVEGNNRRVKTPWQDAEMPFEKAAEMGTRRIIKQHSTISIMMTTDGSVAGFAREAYLSAEEKVITQLKKQNKPFVVLVNTKDTSGESVRTVVAEIQKKYSVTAIAINAENLTTESINLVFSTLLAEFPVLGFRVTMPKFLTVLDSGHEIVNEALEALKKFTSTVKRMADNETTKVFEKSVNFAALKTINADIVTGIITYEIEAKADLYTRVLRDMSGVDLPTEAHLVAFLSHMGAVKRAHDKLSFALDQAKESGYGIVEPTFDEYVLDRPQLFKSGKNHGIKFRATAPSLHLVRVDVGAEVSPAIGTKPQSEEMLKLLQREFDENKLAVWQTPIFGKSLESLVQDGITSKTNAMPVEARRKMKRTITKIVNNGRGGVICILL
ncbi:MAG: stage IV sporulation protein A [Firmicutes bacterium]|nr:stage IV sporulation protein A [Bacillota bacterium]